MPLLNTYRNKKETTSFSCVNYKQIKCCFNVYFLFLKKGGVQYHLRDSSSKLFDMCAIIHSTSTPKLVRGLHCVKKCTACSRAKDHIISVFGQPRCFCADPLR
ncbi:uncharacterized protein LOC143241979 [Tachypleus tridentatus]|uniref:uncharacterized protein LOC143241979 n=1 Tax=Tachypleus tridentatus TaxID=6853 RepID=UPI003FD64E29